MELRLSTKGQIVLAGAIRRKLGLQPGDVLAFLEHESHQRVARWVHGLAAKGPPELATCSITELGFVRVLSHQTRQSSGLR